MKKNTGPKKFLFEKRNYRFLLSHGKKIEMYDNRGKIVNGFKLKNLKKPLENPPRHIRFGNKDYIVLKDIEGQIQILNRQGKDRIQLKQPANSSSNDVFEYRNTFTTTTKDGNLLQIDTKGNFKNRRYFKCRCYCFQRRLAWGYEQNVQNWRSLN